MRSRQSATRTLGWEARHDGWSGGDACSDDTIGHTGFTGTGLWIDFRRGVAWTLLTNRVHPTRHRDTGIAGLRRRVGDLVSGRGMVRRWAGVRCWPALAAARPRRTGGHVEDLVRAYPGRLSGFDGTNLIWRDGTRMPVGPVAAGPSAEEAAARLDPRPACAPLSGGRAALPPPDDPGRVRNQAFFDKMYGDCRAGQVAPKLVRIVWLPKSWGHAYRSPRSTAWTGSWTAVSRELDELPAQFKQYLHPIGGTYNCRAVAGTGQTSMHSWGAAIDINTAYSDYWRWSRSGGDGVYRNRIPAEIVAVFERHGFIWGGRWAHFDTMHFEYRPELLAERPDARE